MNNANDRARVPAGRREGGRFAPEDHGTETATELGDAAEYVTIGDIGSYPSDVNRFVTNAQLSERRSELFEEWKEAADKAVGGWPDVMPSDAGAEAVMEGALNEARMRKDPDWDGWDEDTAPHVTKEELREAIDDMASEEDTFETNGLMERMLREPEDRDDLLSPVYTFGRPEGNIYGARWEDRTALFFAAKERAVNGTPADIEADPLAGAIADAARGVRGRRGFRRGVSGRHRRSCMSSRRHSLPLLISRRVKCVAKCVATTGHPEAIHSYLCEMETVEIKPFPRFPNG